MFYNPKHRSEASLGFQVTLHWHRSAECWLEFRALEGGKKTATTQGRRTTPWKTQPAPKKVDCQLWRWKLQDKSYIATTPCIFSRNSSSLIYVLVMQRNKWGSKACADQNIKQKIQRLHQIKNKKGHYEEMCVRRIAWLNYSFNKDCNCLQKVRPGFKYGCPNLMWISHIGQISPKKRYRLILDCIKNLRFRHSDIISPFPILL